MVYARGCCTAAAGRAGTQGGDTHTGDNQPNGRVELWPILKEGEQSFKKELWLVAAESVSPGQEIRVDYSQCGAEHHIPPATSSGGGGAGGGGAGGGGAGGGEAWRGRRVATPGGGGYARVLHQLRRLQRVQQIYTAGYTKVGAVAVAVR